MPYCGDLELAVLRHLVEVDWLGSAAVDDLDLEVLFRAVPEGLPSQEDSVQEDDEGFDLEAWIVVDLAVFCCWFLFFVEIEICRFGGFWGFVQFWGVLRCRGVVLLGVVRNVRPEVYLFGRFWGLRDFYEGWFADWDQWLDLVDSSLAVLDLRAVVSAAVVGGGGWIVGVSVEISRIVFMHFGTNIKFSVFMIFPLFWSLVEILWCILGRSSSLGALAVSFVAFFKNLRIICFNFDYCLRLQLSTIRS